MRFAASVKAEDAVIIRSFKSQFIFQFLHIKQHGSDISTQHCCRNNGYEILNSSLELTTILQYKDLLRTQDRCEAIVLGIIKQFSV